MRPARLSSLLSSISANVVDEEPILYIHHLVSLQGLPFSIVPDCPCPCPCLCLRPNLVAQSRSFCALPSCSSQHQWILMLVAVDVKQRQQREVPSRDTGRVEAMDHVVIANVFQ
jgi:hypothetical protein